MKSKIFVTSPLFPNLDNLLLSMEDIWKRKWITNSGFYHQELEKKTCRIFRSSICISYGKWNACSFSCALRLS